MDLLLDLAERQRIDFGRMSVLALAEQFVAAFEQLADRVAPARVESGHDVGWSIDSLEAQAFAYLAVRSLRGLPITFSGTTGAPGPLAGGVLARP